MPKCYYSYSFDLETGLILEEILDKGVVSPMQAVGCNPPMDFDDYIDIWKHMCFPIFENSSDEKVLTRNYFKKAYKRGERMISVDLEHNPVKNTYATKYTRVNVKLYEEEKTGHPYALVMWEDNTEFKMKERNL